ncbi:MBL fold metallo-hydrolase [Paenibacillus pini]|uniref:Metallo-beta-lactamase domain-containing protein n=1 Tax=Paenibacillus pini JCM 16418 TaxID=1236976 RepID=W7YVB5_9BACL|nr:MBL fold metallo-hydrolase [Paenibacillus pini]GAF06374.1 hypothetical [Paenibacillus pini JCM 16418]
MKEQESLKVFILECVRNQSLSKESAFLILKSLSNAVSMDEVDSALDACIGQSKEVTDVQKYWMHLTQQRRKLSAKRSHRQLQGPTVEAIPHGPMGSNCYLVVSDGEGVIIDPGSSFDKIWPVVEKSGAKIKYIFITHGHFDHMGSMEELKAATGASIVLHSQDEPALSQSVLNGSFLFSQIRTFRPIDITVGGGETFKVGGYEYEIVHTPGHTIGSICIRLNAQLFSGDMLFSQNDEHVGPITGDAFELMRSYQKLCSRMKGDILVYPGHGTPFWVDDNLKAAYMETKLEVQREGPA